MAGQPVEPKDFPAVHVPTYHPVRRNWGSSFIIGALMFGCCVGGLLAWFKWLNNEGSDASRDTTKLPETAATQPVVKSRIHNNNAKAPQPSDSQVAVQAVTMDESGLPVKFSATGESQFGWKDPFTENPFESKLPIQPGTTIDDLVLSKLAELNIKPANLCSDEVFFRRIYIDTLGTLPTVDEAKQFLDDPDPMKRAKLIDQALERSEFADYWAMKWCDILRVKAEFPIKLWPNAAQAYHHWIRTSIKENLPYDIFVRELLTSSGSNFRKPQVNFYRALQSKEPKALAQAVALTFLCERTDQWPEQRLEGMSAFFSQVGYKPTGEWKEEIIFFDRRKGKESVNEPLTAVYPNGATVQIPVGKDPREVFADWLVHDKNPWFARAITNRVWYWLNGRGIVDPPDDVRSDNPASNLALLNHLADEFVASDYDMRHLFRLILNSQTYQLSCIPASEDSRAAENFAHYQVRRQDAEVLIDAICQLTGTFERYSSIIPEPFTFLPDGTRAVALPDGSITSSFLEMFGRPPRDTGLEEERNNKLTAAQALHLLNSNHLRNKLKQGPGLKDLLSKAKGSEETTELLYLAILSRRPTNTEKYMVMGLSSRDAAWALVNTDEFLFRH